MTIIAIVILFWGASALVRASKEVKAERERERLRREQAARSAELARMTAEWKQRQAEAKIETARLIAVEREQMRLAKEQEKQAAQLAKHEKRIADLEFRMSQAESDIEFLNDRIAQLDAQRDLLMLQQSGTVPGGKEHTKYQTKIISIDNQIHTAENKLKKAQHTRDMAKKEMGVA